jgi:hypothetical protein
MIDAAPEDRVAVLSFDFHPRSGSTSPTITAPEAVINRSISSRTVSPVRGARASALACGALDREAAWRAAARNGLRRSLAPCAASGREGPAFFGWDWVRMYGGTVCVACRLRAGGGRLDRGPRQRFQLDVTDADYHSSRWA